MTNLRPLSAAIAAGAVSAAAFCGTGIAGADPNAVAPTMLNTTCTLDQIMAATKVADPVAYGAIVEKYNLSRVGCRAGRLPPEFVPAEVAAAAAGRDRRDRPLLPAVRGLFTAAAPVADAVAAQCSTFPATDPGVWNLTPNPT